MAISMQESTRVHGGNPRRNSMGKAISSENGKKSLPRYLRASSGSCHDFCKYGRHHESEKKLKLPFLRRKMKTPVDDHFAVEILEASKKPVVKLKPLPNLETCRLDSPELIKREVSTKSVDSEMFRSMLRKTPGERMIEPIKSPGLLRKVTAKKTTSVQKMPTNSTDNQSSLSRWNFSERKRLSIHGMKKASTDEPRISHDVKYHLSPGIQKQNASLSTARLEVLSKVASLRTEEVNLSTNDTISSKRNLSLPCASEPSSGGRKGDNHMRLKTRTQRLTIVQSQGSSRGSLSPKSSCIRVPRLMLSKTSTRITRGFSSPRASLSPKVSISPIESWNAKMQQVLKVVSLPNNQRKVGKVDICRPGFNIADPDRPNRELKLKNPNKDLVHEKTLYVIKVETEKKYVDSDVNAKVLVDLSLPPSSSSPRTSSPLKSPSFSHHGEQDDESEYCVTEGEEEPCSDYDESECVKYGEALEIPLNNVHRNGEVVPSEDNDGLPVKLRFRRGKVFEIISESKSPRRLKFRHARTLSENQNRKNDSRMNIKRRDTDKSNQDHQEESEKVVLRHQDVEGKKDVQGLLNNVIEETASKLVETRKSKVKALVGAFETVISLRDGNPCSNIIS